MSGHQKTVEVKKVRGGKRMTQGDMGQSKIVGERRDRRDWRVDCYNAKGKRGVCIIDSDHGAIRIGLAGGQEEFVELQGKWVNKFQAALDVASLGSSSGGSESPKNRWVKCAGNWGEEKICSVVASYSAIASYNDLRIVLIAAATGQQQCFLELRGKAADEFCTAFRAARNVFHADVAIYGEDWADEPTHKSVDLTKLPPSDDDTELAAEIGQMVASQAPRRFALCAEIGDCVADSMTIAWGMAFDNKADVISVGPHGVRGVFNSAESARRMFSLHDKIRIRLVWVDNEMQEQITFA